MARVLVTGAGGFIGRYAVRQLQKDGWEVIGVGREAPRDKGLSRAISADLLTKEDAYALVRETKADVLLHCAWHSDPRSRWHSAANLDWSASTIHMARTFAEMGGQHMVFVSSCAVYDFAKSPMHLETDRLNPASLYGAAKASTAGLLMAASSALGLSVTEARPFFCYGAGEPAGRLVPDLIAGISRGDRVACTDGQQKRDYLHAGDIARALSLLCSIRHTGPVNVASGTALRVADLIDAFAQQLGRPDLVDLGAISRPEDDPDTIVADTTLLNALGFHPNIDLATGVAETLSRDPHVSAQ